MSEFLLSDTLFFFVRGYSAHIPWCLAETSSREPCGISLFLFLFFWFSFLFLVCVTISHATQTIHALKDVALICQTFAAMDQTTVHPIPALLRQVPMALALNWLSVTLVCIQAMVINGVCSIRWGRKTCSERLLTALIFLSRL